MKRPGRPTGLMFHHFFDGKHPRGQGALSADGFRKMILHVGRENILGAGEWLDAARSGRLRPESLCITFDDGLRCQFDVALPVLKEFGLTAFWFVYSSAVERQEGPLEVYRYFRTVHFGSVDEFYDAFFRHLAATPAGEGMNASLADFERSDFLKEYVLYSRSDRQFRYFRDIVLKEEGYYRVMDSMLESYGVSPRELAPLLWLNERNLQELRDEGHEVGLHSYSHPTLIDSLPEERQREEYGRNFRHLESVTGAKPVSMSHPCGFYNPSTLRILRELGIEVGFRDNLDAAGGSLLEIPRLDHAFLMKEMGIYENG